MAIVFLTEQSRTIGSSYVPPMELATVKTPFEAYLETMPPMQRGKAKNSLERLQRFNGEVMQRRIWAERQASVSATRIDWIKGRVYTANDDRFLNIEGVTKSAVNYLTWLMEMHQLR